MISGRPFCCGCAESDSDKEGEAAATALPSAAVGMLLHFSSPA